MIQIVRLSFVFFSQRNKRSRKISLIEKMISRLDVPVGSAGVDDPVFQNYMTGLFVGH